jgi:hypothetical protein
VSTRLPDDLVAEIVTSQTASGAFTSTMVENGDARDDENGFVTAQVLKALGPHTADPRLTPATERALDFLTSCEDPKNPGVYRFWTDTSLDVAALRATVLRGLFGHRVSAHTDPPASWVRAGAFWTWLDDDFGYNVVDCTVNANVAALLAVAGLTHLPCYEAVCTMIEAGLAAAGDNEHHARLLSPYYPHPCELLFAVEAAVAGGAHDLRPSLAALCKWARPVDDSQPVFSSAYGRVRWHVPLLHHIRAARAEPVSPSAQSSSALLMAAAVTAPSVAFAGASVAAAHKQSTTVLGDSGRAAT